MDRGTTSRSQLKNRIRSSKSFLAWESLDGLDVFVTQLPANVSLKDSICSCSSATNATLPVTLSPRLYILSLSPSIRMRSVGTAMLDVARPGISSAGTDLTYKGLEALQ